MSKVSLREQAYKHLQQKILSGSLQAGSVVSELSLAKEMGLGRTPVREAHVEFADKHLDDELRGSDVQRVEDLSTCHGAHPCVFSSRLQTAAVFF